MREAKANQQLAYWVAMGLTLGYSSCCVKSFVNLQHVGEPSRKLTGTGYIPCAECDKMSENELIVIINSKRAPGLPPFPCNHRFEVGQELLIQALTKELP